MAEFDPRFINNTLGAFLNAGRPAGAEVNPRVMPGGGNPAYKGVTVEPPNVAAGQRAVDAFGQKALEAFQQGKNFGQAFRGPPGIGQAEPNFELVGKSYTPGVVEPPRVATGPRAVNPFDQKAFEAFQNGQRFGQAFRGPPGIGISEPNYIMGEAGPTTFTGTPRPAPAQLAYEPNAAAMTRRMAGPVPEPGISSMPRDNFSFKMAQGGTPLPGGAAEGQEAVKAAGLASKIPGAARLGQVLEAAPALGAGARLLGKAAGPVALATTAYDVGKEVLDPNSQFRQDFNRYGDEAGAQFQAGNIGRGLGTVVRGAGGLTYDLGRAAVAPIVQGAGEFLGGVLGTSPAQAQAQARPQAIPAQAQAPVANPARQVTISGAGNAVNEDVRRQAATELREQLYSRQPPAGTRTQFQIPLTPEEQLARTRETLMGNMRNPNAGPKAVQDYADAYYRLQSGQPAPMKPKDVAIAKSLQAADTYQNLSNQYVKAISDYRAQGVSDDAIRKRPDIIQMAKDMMEAEAAGKRYNEVTRNVPLTLEEQLGNLGNTRSPQ